MEEDKKRRLRWRIIVALVEVSLGGCYGFATILAILSYLWQTNSSVNAVPDPYFGYAVLFGLAAVFLSAFAIAVKRLR